MSDIGNVFGSSRLMAILRGFTPTNAVERATHAWASGIDLVEVPIQDPTAVPALEAVVAEARRQGRLVGAGTITDVAQVETVSRLGVDFTVAPGLSEAVADASRAAGIPHLPGVASATEIQGALDMGLGWMKAFPAVTLGPQWFQAMRGPFPHVRFVATGGMSIDNARAFLDAGASLVAMGSGLPDAAQLRSLLTEVGAPLP